MHGVMVSFIIEYRDHSQPKPFFRHAQRHIRADADALDVWAIYRHVLRLRRPICLSVVVHLWSTCGTQGLCTSGPTPDRGPRHQCAPLRCNTPASLRPQRRSRKIPVALRVGLTRHPWMVCARRLRRPARVVSRDALSHVEPVALYRAKLRPRGHVPRSSWHRDGLVNDCLRHIKTSRLEGLRESTGKV